MIEKLCKTCNLPYEKGNAHFGLCQRCNVVRLVDLKLGKNKTISINNVNKVKVYSIKDLRQTTIPKSTPKLKNKHINTYGVKTLKEFFAKIWIDRPHNCTHCNIGLGSEPIVHYFSHIYPKSLKPWLKFDSNNIELLCIDCHTAHDFGKRKNSLR